MLAFRPETVRMGEAREFRQLGDRHREGVQAPARHPADRLRLDGERPHDPGAAGDASKATAEKGEASRRLRRRRLHRPAARRAGLRSRPPRARPAGAMSKGPGFVHERQLLALGARFVAGVDEVGRGPLAGPVGVAAVIFRARQAAAARHRRFQEARPRAARGFVPAHPGKRACRSRSPSPAPRRSTLHNIRGATLRAMARAVAGLSRAPGLRADRRPRRARGAWLSRRARSSAATRCRCRSPPPRSSPRWRATG